MFVDSWEWLTIGRAGPHYRGSIPRSLLHRLRLQMDKMDVLESRISWLHVWMVGGSGDTLLKNIFVISNFTCLSIGTLCAASTPQTKQETAPECRTREVDPMELLGCGAAALPLTHPALTVIMALANTLMLAHCHISQHGNICWIRCPICIWEINTQRYANSAQLQQQLYNLPNIHTLKYIAKILTAQSTCPLKIKHESSVPRWDITAQAFTPVKEPIQAVWVSVWVWVIWTWFCQVVLTLWVLNKRKLVCVRLHTDWQTSKSTVTSWRLRGSWCSCSEFTLRPQAAAEQQQPGEVSLVQRRTPSLPLFSLNKCWWQWWQFLWNWTECAHNANSI